MFDLELATRLAAAVGLGLLVGLEREWAHRDETSFAGVRTFALISLTGAAAAYASSVLALPLLLVGAFAALAALIVVAYFVSSRAGDLGMTTEVSALLAFVLGALCLAGHVSVAAAIGVVVALLLALKDTLHALARRIEERDVEATLRFLLITAIVLPLVPDQTYGPPPFDVLNPYTTWLMVVLIAGLNFAGYLLVKLLGAEHGLGLTGLLGGLVSSTAVTLGFAQRSRQHPDQSRALAQGLLLAWTVMFLRVIAEVAVVNRGLLPRVAPAIGVLAAAGLLASAAMHRALRGRSSPTAALESPRNPLELSLAIRFGALYALITLGARVAQVYAGDAGLYAAGALAGLTDVDAITLSMADFAARSPESSGIAARAIGIAVMSNTAVKCGIAFTLGSRALRRSVVWIAAALGAASALALWLAGALGS
jgi:uncharacterized membrane protein (DUF4010 family)